MDSQPSLRNKIAAFQVFKQSNRHNASMSDIHSSVKEYYGEKLTKTADLLTNACTTSGAPPPHIRSILCKVHKEVKAKFYGCGLVVPDLLDGCSVLDLGSGSGQVSRVKCVTDLAQS